MMDSDLAGLYGVTTGRLNQQVSRNIGRFPDDFMFRLTQEENASLMLQSAISKKSRGGRRKLPLVFTQEGVSMLSGVLQSERAIEVNIAIMRAFAHMRRMVSRSAEIVTKLEELERKSEMHDKNIRSLFDALRRLMAPLERPEPPRRGIGFKLKPD